MSRFFDFSLHKRTDELLRPAEKGLRDRFHCAENIRLVYGKALSEVDKDVAYSDVTTTMDAVFRLAVQTDDLPEVSEMNGTVLRKLSVAAERLNTNQKRYAERVYENSNVPQQLLPRPSYSAFNDRDEDDNTIELLRR